jgi:hypothetical protein
MSCTTDRRCPPRAIVLGALLLCTLLSLFVAAPSSWGSDVVDHAGMSVSASSASIVAPRTVAPQTHHQVRVSLRVVAFVVIVAALAAAAGGCTRRRAHDATTTDTAHARSWVRRRGPPASCVTSV